MMNCDVVFPLASSLLMLLLRPLIADAVSVGGKITGLAREAAEFLARDDTVRRLCGNNPRSSVSGNGTTDQSSEYRACGAAEVARELAGGGSASEGELEDRGEDWFICAAELWCVMRMLGFAEGDALRGLREDDLRL
ncbi:uncharacterized protein LOC133890216 [Phragmites australis]|uniref:uncharacterized protein LOC133890216 n=1 Tax=Phragmites australis TaxID=29695 RepID=UPI002D782271|nr:uncharacterized protein LOC133890216 [Phragmites australis]